MRVITPIYSDRNELEKVEAEVTTRVLGEESSAARGERGFGGGSPTLRRFLQFFSKTYAFLSILWSKFLLKTRVI